MDKLVVLTSSRGAPAWVNCNSSCDTTTRNSQRLALLSVVAGLSSLAVTETVG